MAAKTSWHRYATKLRQCHPMYIAAVIAKIEVRLHFPYKVSYDNTSLWCRVAAELISVARSCADRTGRREKNSTHDSHKIFFWVSLQNPLRRNLEILRGLRTNATEHRFTFVVSKKAEIRTGKWSKSLVALVTDAHKMMAASPVQFRATSPAANFVSNLCTQFVQIRSGLGSLADKPFRDRQT